MIKLTHTCSQKRSSHSNHLSLEMAEKREFESGPPSSRLHPIHCTKSYLASVILKNLRSLNTEFQAVHEQLKAERSGQVPHAAERSQAESGLDYLDLQLQSAERSGGVDLEAKLFQLASLFQQSAKDYAELSSWNQSLQDSNWTTLVQDLERLHILEPKPTDSESKRRRMGTGDFSVQVDQLGQTESDGSRLEILKQANIHLRKKNAELEAQLLERSDSEGSGVYLEVEIEDERLRVACDKSDQATLVQIRESLDRVYSDLVEEVWEWRRAKDRSDRTLEQERTKWELDQAVLQLGNVQLKSQVEGSEKSFPVAVEEKPEQSFPFGEMGWGDATQSWFQDMEPNYDLIDFSDEGLAEPLKEGKDEAKGDEEAQLETKSFPWQEPDCLVSSSNSSLHSRGSTPCETDDEVSSLLPPTRPSSLLLRMRKILPRTKTSSRSTPNFSRLSN